jgi:hypothetical protein
MISELGKIYLEKIRKGEICGCVLYTGKECNKCKAENKKRQILSDRNKKINKIFGN